MEHPTSCPMAAAGTCRTTFGDNSLSSGQPRSRSRGKARQWEKTSAPGQQGSAGADPDVALLLRVGREKRRRWLADTLLRKMAGEIGPGAR